MPESSQPDRQSAAPVQAPALSLPKGGGAIRGIGEKFAANPVTGAGSMSVPIASSAGRGGFGPQLALAYDSGSGNGLFGFGWSLGLPQIARKTDKGLPQYDDAAESDVFILSGAEDLTPEFKKDDRGAWVLKDGAHVVAEDEATAGEDAYLVRRYRPRVEGLFARIERWTRRSDGEVHWRSISRDNILTLYGASENSRVADPIDARRVFAWLICETRDDKGNAILYEYKPEDGLGADLAQAHERNRGPRDDRRRTANRHIKRIRYGNQATLLDGDAQRPAFLSREQIQRARWMFELVFDYGEHDADAPTPHDAGDWRFRADPFSSYRAGFELRTCRRCERALMFHHFAGEAQIGDDCLVRSTDFAYAQDPSPRDAQAPVYSFLSAVAQAGYVRRGDGYIKRSMPPVAFDYSQPIVQDAVQEPDAESLENLPEGLAGAALHWADLHGEGLPGVLVEQDGSWFYKRNLSPLGPGTGGATPARARFAPIEPVAARPNLALDGGRAQLMDLSGDGLPDLVALDGPTPGLYEHDDAEGWQPFRPFAARLNRNLRDPNLRFVDLDGDGQADALITEDDALAWHASLGEEGFGPEQRVARAPDEEQGPRLVLDDGEQSIYLADMSGDGLADLVRLRNGEVCYWPNLGYGRFGAKVEMDGAPWFDQPDLFDQRRIRLADIDGSGTADIIYLHRDGARIYFNQSGNCWSRPVALAQLPPADALADVQAVDLLGNGTACLVWSSPLPGESRRPMRYIDLMGGRKPHLLVGARNNLGLEIELQYAPSTRFYLQDKRAGSPWVARLPFPVHCVEKVAMRDKWRGTIFSSLYSYHHGYFDGVEREFRGFGRVEQVDIEDYGAFAAGNAASPYVTDDKRLFQPPVKTVTWHHIGAPLDRERILGQFAHEYCTNRFADPAPGAFREHAPAEPDLAGQDLTNDEWREALRACKGIPLRQEVYELDVDALARGEHIPIRLFSATSHSCHIRLAQPRASNRHAVFHVVESESIAYHYELDLRAAPLAPDPRIAHTLNLRIDEYGNVEQAVTVAYPRWRPVPLDDPLLPQGVEALVRAVQAELHLAYVETRYTGDATGPNDHRLRLPCEKLTYELTGVALDDARYFTLDALRGFRLSERYQASGAAVQEIPYHQLPSRAGPEKRLVEQTRTLFFDADLARPLGMGALNARALPYETYALALTADLLAAIFGDKLAPDVDAALNDAARSGYLSGPDLAARFGPGAEGQHWRRAGIAGFNADAPQHFFLPERYADPFGNITLLDYDPRDLFVRSSADALGSRTEVVEFDFRVLAPRKLKDINGNISEARFDALGALAALAALGNGSEGDSLAGFDDPALNPDTPALIGFFATDDYDEAQARALLGGATARYIAYFGEEIQGDRIVWARHPPCACGIVRERHAAQQPDSPVQAAFEYSDGAGSVLVTKLQAEPQQSGGPLRWVASGRTILNNKGKPVKQYEPYFSAPEVGHRFEDPAEAGVTPVIYYDAVGRVVRAEAPDGSYGRAEFSPWRIADYDANDTLGEPGNAWFARRIASRAPAERRAAQQAAEHAGTPAVRLLDSLARTVVSIAHNRSARAGAPADEKLVTFSKLDAEGKPLWVQDARGARVMQYVAPPLPGGARPFDDPQNLAPQGFAPCYDMAGATLFQRSADAGDGWLLNDAAGKPMFAWNSRGFRTRTEYDALRRPTDLFVLATGDAAISGAPLDPAAPAREALVERRVYGERHPDASANLRGRIFRIYDGSGVATSARYDFKGNLLIGNRRFARDYAGPPDWSALAGLDDPSAIAGAAEPLLEDAPPLITQTTYDALNRPASVTTPDGSVYRPAYNAANLLERVDVGLRGADPTPFVANIDYNAKGQRELIAYANGATTTYAYDPLTFRLTGLQTTRPADRDATASQIFKSATVVQDLRYLYDPVGNIARIEDAALPRIVAGGAAVAPVCEYRYDAIYRLAGATGREHAGQTDFALDAPGVDQRDYPFAGLRAHPNDLQGLRGYVETYDYDAAGNIVRQAHHAGGDLDQPGQALWNRRYQYALDSNRLMATSLPGDADGTFSARYQHDAHGNIIGMPNLPTMRWDFKDQLSASARQAVNSGAPETTYYTYDASGQRARKVVETAAGARRRERLYLGGVEIYREYSGGAVAMERQTLHIVDDKQRIALIETRTQGDDRAPPQAIRFQLGNHLGSASLELDERARVISYEEYHPYGTSAFQAGRSAAEASLKRYRYTGKERDDESGLYYHGARYYAPWLGRWASCDPIGIAGGMNAYVYSRNAPIVFIDPDGAEPFDPQAGNWFVKKLLYGKDTPILDAITSDRNLEKVQYAAAAVAIVAASVATGGAAAEAAAAYGASTAGAAAVGAGVGGAVYRAEVALAKGSTPREALAHAADPEAIADSIILAGAPEAPPDSLSARTSPARRGPGVRAAAGEGPANPRAVAPKPADPTKPGASTQSAGKPSAPEVGAADPAAGAGRPQLPPGGNTTLTKEQVQRFRGTNKERGDAGKRHQAELSGGSAKEEKTQTALGARLHDVRDEPTPTNTIMRREVKNYRTWVTQPSGERVQKEVPVSAAILDQVRKDKLWIREGKKLGEHRVVQWDFVGAGPNAELRDLLTRSGIPYSR